MSLRHLRLNWREAFIFFFDEWLAVSKTFETQLKTGLLPIFFFPEKHLSFPENVSFIKGTLWLLRSRRWRWKVRPSFWERFSKKKGRNHHQLCEETVRKLCRKRTVKHATDFAPLVFLNLRKTEKTCQEIDICHHHQQESSNHVLRSILWTPFYSWSDQRSSHQFNDFFDREKQDLLLSLLLLDDYKLLWRKFRHFCEFGKDRYFLSFLVKGVSMEWTGND